MPAGLSAIDQFARDVDSLLAQGTDEEALRYAMKAVGPMLVSPSDSLRRELRREVFRKFRKRDTYQKSDFESVDYAQFELASELPLFRGPKPSELALAEGRYFCVMGGAQTFGRLVRRPWPIRLSKAIGLPVLNLSHSGAGPDFFLAPSLIRLAQRARFVILQVTSGRSIGCSEYPGGRLVAIGAGTFTRKIVLDQMMDDNDARQCIRRWNDNYFETYRQLRGLIARPTLLLWISHRAPGGWSPDNLTHKPRWGSFPQLVGQDLYERVAQLFNERLEHVTDRSSEQPRSRITGEPCPYFGSGKTLKTEFHYYPSTESHKSLALRLEMWAKANTQPSLASRTPPGAPALNIVQINRKG